MIAGIVAGRYVRVPATFWAVTAFVAFAVAAGTLARAHLHLITSICAGVVIFSLAAVHGNLAYSRVPGDAVVSFTGRRRIPATVRGRIVTSPQTRHRGYRDQTQFVLTADEIATDAGPRSVSGLVRVTVDEGDERLLAGQRIELVGWLGRVRPPGNPGQHDWAADARTTHTLVTMRVPGRSGVTITARAGRSSLGRWLWRIRAGARQHLAGAGGSGPGRLVNALILGERDPALATLSRAMVRAGIAHFLSISGLHLGVFLGFAYLLCRLVTLTPRRAASVVLVVLGVYVALAEPRPALLRSAIMAASLCAATIWQRRGASLNALAAAAVILLAFNPMQLFGVGFQLSFAIVAGLILGIEPMRDFLFGRWLRRRGLVVFRSERRLARWLNYTAADWLSRAVAMCLVAYLTAVPLVAVHFGLFSPYAPVLSLLLGPLVVAVLVPGYVSLALAWPMPNLSAAVGTLARLAADALTWAVALLERLPGLCFDLRPVGPAWAGVWYVAILLVLARGHIRFGRVLAAGGAAAVIAVGIYTQRTAPAPESMELNILAVGGAQCALLRTPGGSTVLLDAGVPVGGDGRADVLDPFRHHQRLPAPEVAFISHANCDHYNALLGGEARGAPAAVYLNDYFGDPEMTSPEALGLLQRLDRAGTDVRRLRDGETVDLDGRTRVEVLWPPRRRRRDLSVNETSLVLRITCDGRSVLLPGDLDSTGQAELTRHPERIRSDVLVLPHHGGWETTLPAFVAAVSPKVVLVSAGSDPHGPSGKGQAPAAFYTRLKTAYKYYSTARHGWLQVRLSAAGPIVRTMRP